MRLSLGGEVNEDARDRIFLREGKTDIEAVAKVIDMTYTDE